MKELALLLVLSTFAPDAKALNIEKFKQKMILKVEKKAKTYKVFRIMHNITNVHTDYGSIRIRPNEIRYDKKFDKKHLRIESNGKNIKANFSFSF